MAATDPKATFEIVDQIDKGATKECLLSPEAAGQALVNSLRRPTLFTHEREFTWL